jgi:hypothetical protein
MRWVAQRLESPSDFGARRFKKEGASVYSTELGNPKLEVPVCGTFKYCRAKEARMIYAHRIAQVAIVAALSCLPSFSQTNPVVGDWKLNTEKSKSSAGLPQNQTTHAEPSGDGIKSTTQSTSADGKAKSYTWTANFDGKDYPITGDAPSGADTIAIKRTSTKTFDATLKKGGKVVQTTKTVYSKDGKTRIQMVKGTDEHGKKTSTTLVYEKQ